MAIAFDNASSATGTAANSVQWTHTASGANTYIAVGASNFNGTSLSAGGAGGVGLTFKGSVFNNTQGIRGNLFTGAGIPTGVITVSCIAVGASTDDWCFLAVSYTGVQQTTPDGNMATGTGAAATVHNLSFSSTNGSQTIGFLGGQSLTASTVTNPATQTERGFKNSRIFLEVADKAAVGSTTSMSWSTSVAKAPLLFGVTITATASTTPAVSFIVGIPLLGVGQ